MAYEGSEKQKLNDPDAYNLYQGQVGREKARQRGLAAQEQLVSAANEGLARFDRQAADRQRQIRFGAARGLAASAPTGRMAAGGGMLGAMGQAGMDAEMAGIRQTQADEQQRLGLRTGAAQAELGAATFAAEVGNEAQEYSQALAEGEADILKSIDAKTNMLGNTDEEAVRLERDAIIARIGATNPRAAAELKKKYTAGGEGYKRLASSFE